MMKKLIAIVLLLTLVVVPTCSVPTYADSIGNIDEDSNVSLVNNYNKIHFYFDSEEHTTIDSKSELRAALNALEARTEEYAAYNAQAVDDINDDLHITVEFASDFTQTKEYLEFAEEAQTLTTHDEVLDFRQRLNAFSLRYHTALVNQNLDHLSVFGDSHIYTASYSPFVTVVMEPTDLTEQSLITLCNTEDVSNISLNYELEAEESGIQWDLCLDGVNASNIVNNNTYTGEGIRIGVFEASGICDLLNVNLYDKDISLYRNRFVDTEHATAVTSILVQIAPDAKYYVLGEPNINIATALDWFIESNCDVINCSTGWRGDSNFTYENGEKIYAPITGAYRYNIDGIFDYYIQAHSVTICVASGNIVNDPSHPLYNPNGIVTSPGYAHNAITVGGVNRYLDSSTPSGGVWRYADFTSNTTIAAAYNTPTNVIKPNISAPFSVYIPNVGSWSGTSFSTPIVTGGVALLMERRYASRIQPHRIMATLTATAVKTDDYVDNRGNFNNKVGAGILNIEGAINVNRWNLDTILNTSQPGTTVIETTLNLDEGDQIQLALYWLITTNKNANNSENVTSYYMTDYDLKLYDPSNNYVASSLLSASNIELIRYTATETGTYRVVAHQYSSINSNVSFDYIALLCNILTG